MCDTPYIVKIMAYIIQSAPTCEKSSKPPSFIIISEWVSNSGLTTLFDTSIISSMSLSGKHLQATDIKYLCSKIFQSSLSWYPNKTHFGPDIMLTPNFNFIQVLSHALCASMFVQAWIKTKRGHFGIIYWIILARKQIFQVISKNLH